MRAWIAAFALALTGTAALASPLLDSITSLRTAVETRMAAIQLPFTPATSREHGKLRDADEVLSTYIAFNVYDHVEGLARAGKLLDSSRTKDPGVIGAAAAVVSCAADETQNEIADATSLLGLLIRPQFRTKAEAKIAAVQKLADKARVKAPTDPVGAINLLKKALAKANAARVYIQAHANMP